jgi:hypothetical protein
MKQAFLSMERYHAYRGRRQQSRPSEAEEANARKSELFLQRRDRMSDKQRSAFFRALGRRMWEPLIGLVAMRSAPVRDLEARIARLEDDRAIRDLHLAYTYSYDAGDVAGAIRCFHRDCVLVNPRGIYEGIAAIEANYRFLITRRRFSFHNTTNVTVRISDDGSEAGMTAYLDGVAVQLTGTVVGISGTYVDRLVRTEDGWKIIERRITSNVRYHLPVAPQVGVDTSPAPPGTSPGGSQEWLDGEALL